MTDAPRSASVAEALIGQILSQAGSDTQLLSAREREWASMTFSGARHCIALRICMHEAAVMPPRWLSTLCDYNFHLDGQIVADCSITVGRAARDASGVAWMPCTVELLTITAD